MNNFMQQWLYSFTNQLTETVYVEYDGVERYDLLVV